MREKEVVVVVVVVDGGREEEEKWGKTNAKKSLKYLLSFLCRKSLASPLRLFWCMNLQINTF